MRHRALVIQTLVLVNLLAGGAAAQEPAGGAPSGDPAAEQLQKLLQARDPAAIPLLEEEFERASSQLEKQRTASLLVAWGVRDPYFAFLLRAAEEAIDSGMPFPLGVNEQGEIVRKVYTEEFLAWCRARGLDPGQAAWRAVYGFPTDVAFLAETSDPRAVPALKRGLLSANPMIAYQSARGLGLLDERQAVPTVIRRLERGPQEVSLLMANALVYFDDPRARQATEEFFVDKQLLAEMRRSAEIERAQRSGSTRP